MTATDIQRTLSEAEQRAMTIVLASLVEQGLSTKSFSPKEMDLVGLGIHAGTQGLLEIMQKRGICPKELL